MTTGSAHVNHCYCQTNTGGLPTCCFCGALRPALLPVAEAPPQDDLNLAPIKAREAAATKGPWTAERYDDYDHEFIVRFVGSYGNYGELDSSMLYQADAEFIAHARADITALIKEIERLRAASCAPRTPAEPENTDHVTLNAILDLLAQDRPEGLHWPGVARLIRRVIAPPIPAEKAPTRMTDDVRDCDCADPEHCTRAVPGSCQPRPASLGAGAAAPRRETLDEE